VKAIKALTMYLAGFVIVPILCLVTKQGANRWCWLDGIYGNKVDSINGDSAYKAKVATARRFRWCQLRNPINNYLRSLGPNGAIQYIDIYSPYAMSITVNGVHYRFSQTVIIPGKLYWWWGYKLLDDPRTGSKVDIGHHFENQMILWPLKNKRIRNEH